MELHTWNVTEAALPPKTNQIWLENPEVKEQHPLPQRYFMKLAYRGGPFHGWQSQPNAVSVQSEIENALQTVLRKETKITGAGRTDTGVNARVMYAHLDINLPGAMSVERLVTALNRLVGRDIAIYSLTPVAKDAHARFDATSRTYKYFISLNKNPFLYPLSWQATCQLDVDAMNKASEILLSISDFTSFAKLHSDAKTNICKVTRADWKKNDNFLVFTITADRFLRNMVRAVVGTLVDVGRHKISIDDFKKIIEAKDRCAAGTSMPPEGLFLWDITYPFISE
ncbi:MAG: tRNA pseudouridine(38-40) synthase TruA [Muribaculaceae bacterium]|nr:tRNA pseudouridine(38-40) synthase TruA [Muribaculaceae bacterium]